MINKSMLIVIVGIPIFAWLLDILIPNYPTNWPSIWRIEIGIILLNAIDIIWRRIKNRK